MKDNKIYVTLTDEEYSMVKEYAAAKREYETGKGYTVKNVLALVVAMGLDALSESEIFDENGHRVKWNSYGFINATETDRKAYRKS